MSKAQVIVYAGPKYGQVHEVIAHTDGLLTVRHRASGTTIKIHSCDMEPAPIQTATPKTLEPIS